jgi:glycosyltransferase involved in cell wall biosynthesis
MPRPITLSTLYLCYFGLREPLVQTQVLPYLRHLAAAGVRVHLLTFEPDMRERWTGAQLNAERARLAADGIAWHCLAYHKRPSLPATLYDTLAGALASVRLARRERLDVLHARAHVPMAMALLARPFARCRMVFDLRGLIAEEYADAGVWKENSLPFRLVKWIERAGLRRADQIVVLTKRVRDYIVEQGLAGPEKMEVIPCCVDFSRYESAGDSAALTAGDGGAIPSAGAAEGDKAGGRFEVIYAGAVTGLYMLEEMGRFFLAVRASRPGAFFRVLTKAPPAEAAARLASAGLDARDFAVESAAPSEVPGYLRRARLGVSFRKPTFSQIAASPTKVPEYLAAGLPVVSNAGIGDTDALLEEEEVGVIVEKFDAESYAAAARDALALADDPRTAARCELVAAGRFDLARVGGVGYTNVYRRISEQHFSGGLRRPHGRQ